VAEKCELLCNHLEQLGHLAEVEAQDMLARLTLDVVLMAGFGIHSSTIADPQPVPLLKELHYAMDESFRCARETTRAPMPVSTSAAQLGLSCAERCGT
jgi:hypothetical protein